MFGSISLATRFLIAPILGVIFALVLYLSSNQVIESNTALFRNLSKANLVQISEINQVSILLTNSNSEIITLLLETEDLDEEEIYVEGKKQLNKLYNIEKRLQRSIGENNSLQIDGKYIFKHIQTAFSAYRFEAVSAIEMSSVDAKQAIYELVHANKKLKVLNNLFLTLSIHYEDKLNKQAELVEGNLYKKTYITELAFVFMVLMLWSAFYFSRTTSKGLTQVYDALILLAKGNTDVKVQHNNDDYIKNIWGAVEEFKESIKANNIYKNDLLIQRFAMDQHAIITMTNLKGKINYVNDKFCDISGYNEDELIGKNHRILNSGNQPKEYWKNMYSTVSKGDVWHDEVKNIKKQGEFYWVDTTIIPMTSVEDKDRVVGYLSIRTDITQKKLQYEKLIEANAMAESAVIAKSHFLASMSHEIRTPMNGVIGMLDILLNDSLSDIQKHHAELAQTSAKSLLSLINDILDFSKIDANKLELECHDFDLRSLLVEFSDFMRFQAEEKQLSLILDTSFPSVMVVGDPGRLRQILMNIVGNAIKFTESGNVSIRANLIAINEKEWKFECTIADTGIGISGKMLPFLFDSFSQADVSTSRKYGGTGLGLAISKRLAKLMNGDISVNSEVGKGTSFTCLVDLKKSLKLSADVNTLVDKNIELSLPKWPVGLGILLVEDNRINQVVALGVLKRFGLIADVAKNGIEALEMLQNPTKTYHLILMDCQMPEMDGYETTEKIRENREGVINPDIPIIAMTANAMKGDREKCLNVGMDDYLTKPIEPEILLEKLKIWIL